jgi:hypothetical protein
LDAQDAFRQAILDSKDRVVAIGFTNPDELATKIVSAIRNWERESTAHGANPTLYLQALWEDTRFIAIRGLRVGNESAHQFNIDQLYTPLTTVLAGAERKEGPDDRQAVPLQ